MSTAGLAFGVDLLDRRSCHRPVVVLAKAAVAVEGKAFAESDLCGLDGAAEVRAEDGVDSLSASALAELLCSLASRLGERRVAPAGGDAGFVVRPGRVELEDDLGAHSRVCSRIGWR